MGCFYLVHGLLRLRFAGGVENALCLDSVEINYSVCVTLTQLILDMVSMRAFAIFTK